MQLVNIGLTSRKTPLTLREKIHFATEDLATANQSLSHYKSVLESVILSTCNRTEIFALADQQHTGQYYIKHFIGEWFGVPYESLEPYIEIRYNEHMVEHLFLLMTGAQSDVLGETQILGQVRQAYGAAKQAGTTGVILNHLFQQGTAFAKDIHSKYQLNEHPKSLSYQAVELIRQSPNLEKQTLTLIGLGQVGELVLTYLQELPLKNIILVNRTYAKSVRHVSNNIQALPWNQLDQGVNQADIVVTALDSVEPLIGADLFPDDKIKTVYDLGVPRNVHRDVDALPQIQIYNVDHINHLLDTHAVELEEKIHLIRQEVWQEIEQYFQWQNNLDAVPIVQGLREKMTDHLETVETSLENKLPDLSPREKKVISKHLKSLVNAMLKEPVKVTKELMASPQPHEKLSFVADLFGLEITEEQSKEKESIKVGSRGSQLALNQTRRVVAMLEEKFPQESFEIIIIQTEGDKDQFSKLSQIGGKGVFVKQIEQALLDGKIDMAVHSLKDVPTKLSSGTMLAAFPKRANAFDVFISREYPEFNRLPMGAKVGTGSLRRISQLRQLRPDLKFVEIRGNIDTRLNKLKTEDLDAIILAMAGIDRLSLISQGDGYYTELFDVDTMVPAIGQGCLAIQIRSNDSQNMKRLQALNHEKSEICVTAERQYLRRFGVDCRYPIGAYCQFTVSGDLTLIAMLGDETGQQIIRQTFTQSGTNIDPVDLGNAAFDGISQNSSVDEWGR
ncbi:hydroxymethylbilane synthase [Suicoccus acidiformans]|uniref:hydroxymethylbilane synthase n=1 Tax=Suicoccus acidiformans TaxID=2036206 RepID=UPI0013C3167C|nr:hydroxymethylbilane synthase [Suicoccus acidiformans]